MKDGGSAFPNESSEVTQYKPSSMLIPGSTGMTLRDYFAAKAMQGHLSNPAVTENPAYDREGLVKDCYQMADAMIKERERV